MAIQVFGGATLKPFTTALIVGFIAGTYSSIFIATPYVNSKQKWMSDKRQEFRKKLLKYWNINEEEDKQARTPSLKILHEPNGWELRKKFIMKAN